jgi:hypothetical protein
LFNSVKISKIPPFSLRKKRKKEKFKDLGVGKNLTEFSKIPM